MQDKYLYDFLAAFLMLILVVADILIEDFKVKIYKGKTTGMIYTIERRTRFQSYYVEFSYCVDGKNYTGKTSLSMNTPVKAGSPITVQYKIGNPRKYVLPRDQWW